MRGGGGRRGRARGTHGDCPHTPPPPPPLTPLHSCAPAQPPAANHLRQSYFDTTDTAKQRDMHNQSARMHTAGAAPGKPAVPRPQGGQWQAVPLHGRGSTGQPAAAHAPMQPQSQVPSTHAQAIPSCIIRSAKNTGRTRGRGCAGHVAGAGGGGAHMRLALFWAPHTTRGPYEKQRAGSKAPKHASRWRMHTRKKPRMRCRGPTMGFKGTWASMASATKFLRAATGKGGREGSGREGSGAHLPMQPFGPRSPFPAPPSNGLPRSAACHGGGAPYVPRPLACGSPVFY